ncbi:RDD family protein [Streptomyces albofaciens JCM 4342]|uniref:RDD family protein n=1 Tax=Streptomyces albofaciens TaxID=66866 RepID=UPI00123A6049|nr:RDD family protein [Streptomyces albofaciens]KAA6221622.1 RDD family protein [Streptomyces albofaciens JCM 4342]
MSAPSSGSAGGSPTPGFYPDPSIPGYIRYWNGAAWVPGTSRPAPAEGEALPAPPPGAAAQAPAPAPAPTPAVEETGPVFLDDDGEPDGPSGADAASGTGAPASAWQADTARQNGFGDQQQDSRIAWGSPEERQSGLPQQRDEAAAPAATPVAGEGTPRSDGTVTIRAVRDEEGPRRDHGTTTIRAVRPEANAGGKSDTMAFRVAPQPGPAPSSPAPSSPAPGSTAPQPLPSTGAQQPPAAPGPRQGPAQPGPGGPAAAAPGPAQQAPQGPVQPQSGPAPAAPPAPHQPFPPHQAQQPQQPPAPHAPVRQAPPQPAPQAQPAPPFSGFPPQQDGGAAEGVVPWKPPTADPFAAAQAQGRPASLGRRFAARLIDTLVLAVITGAAAVPLWGPATDHIDAKVEAAKQSGREVTVYLLDGTTGPYLAIVLAVLLIGGGLYEVLPTAKWGHTLGKKVCGVRVLDIEGHDTPPLSAVLKRWLVYGVLGVLAVGVVNAVWCLFDRPWRQCWHDKLARTFVAEKAGE